MSQQTPQPSCLNFILLFSIIHVQTDVNILCLTKICSTTVILPVKQVSFTKHTIYLENYYILVHPDQELSKHRSTACNTSVTLNQSAHCVKQMPSDLWLCTQHPSREEQRSTIIMHLHTMTDCPDHIDSYIKQQLATR
jgi:hypothetical protein